MEIRQRQEKWEHAYLAALRRLFRPNPGAEGAHRPLSIRTAYQRDRTGSSTARRFAG